VCSLGPCPAAHTAAGISHSISKPGRAQPTWPATQPTPCPFPGRSCCFALDLAPVCCPSAPPCVDAGDARHDHVLQAAQAMTSCGHINLMSTTDAVWTDRECRRAPQQAPHLGMVTLVLVEQHAQYVCALHVLLFAVLLVQCLAALQARDSYPVGPAGHHTHFGHTSSSDRRNRS
jgi:hypothetical protein